MIVCQSSVDSETAELNRLEKIWNDSHERGDADALDALWADDMEVAVPKVPVMQKSDVAKFARSGRMKFLGYRTSDTHIRLYGDACGRHWPPAANSFDERTKRCPVTGVSRRRMYGKLDIGRWSRSTLLKLHNRKDCRASPGLNE